MERQGHSVFPKEVFVNHNAFHRGIHNIFSVISKFSFLVTLQWYMLRPMEGLLGKEIVIETDSDHHFEYQGF